VHDRKPFTLLPPPPPPPSIYIPSRNPNAGIKVHSDVKEARGEGNGMSVVLMHKPRGSKGVWFPVEQGGFIRVTKGKGKRLKLEVRTATNISQDIHLSLMVDGNLVIPSGGESGLIVESVRSIPSCSNSTVTVAVTEVTLKLTRLSRRLAVIVRAKTTDPVPRTLETRSIEFSAHNNGKERYFTISLC
jgi:hypothetical protein